jgi:fatty-acyl-CoA synthase
LRLPYSRIRIATLGADNNASDCALGQSGVVLVKGPQVFAGYKAAIDNAQAWVDGEWFNTGDLGYMDDEGFLHLTGRAKDLIIRGGHNIDPEIIEEPLNRHPSVLSAIAVGMPDPYAGELPMAFVVLQPGASTTTAELLTYCETEVSERAAIPKRIEIISAMPITAVGAAVLSEHLYKEGISAEVTCRADNKTGLTASIKLRDLSHKAATEELLSSYNVVVNISG